MWVATADAYLVPLSLAWCEERVVLALRAGSRTARNITATGTARLGAGHTRDVVMIDVELERSVPVAASGPEAEAYAAQADWDPRTAGEDYVYLMLRPTRIQAWRESNEIAGRLLMTGGAWLV